MLPRVPSGDRLLEDVESWLKTEYPDVVRSSRLSRLESGEAQLHLALHPAVADLVLTASDTGQIVAEAVTMAAGPGYQRFVGRVLERVGQERAISWDHVGADRPDAERTYLGWLGQALVGARAARAAGGPAAGDTNAGIHVGTPEGTRFTFDGAIATALGPRDDAWLEAAVADTRLATDITPWWADATDARYLLNRALCLMWLEVRWRPPAVLEERLLLDEVHRLLSKAFPLDSSLPYPWHAWAELVGLRGSEDAMTRQVLARVAREPGDDATIGYRRAPVTISQEGWALRIPGSFAERRTPDEWWGGGAGRSITLAAVETGTDAGPMSPQEFIRQFGGTGSPDAIDHRAAGVLGRATLSTDTSSGVEVGVLEGYSAVVGSGAAIRIVFDDAADWQWAIDMWRSLAPG